MNKIFAAVSSVIVLVLVFWLNSIVSEEVALKEEIKKNELLTVEKLKNIRKAQKIYYSTHHTYADDWEKLKAFIKEGKMYNISIKEIVFDLGYGRDSVVHERDTLGAVIVYDSIFSKIPNFELATMEKLPHNPEKSFSLEISSIKTKSGSEIGLVEVKDPEPINPKRRESNKSFTYKPLRFGSITNVTTEGNWE